MRPAMRSQSGGVASDRHNWACLGDSLGLGHWALKKRPTLLVTSWTVWWCKCTWLLGWKSQVWARCSPQTLFLNGGKEQIEVSKGFFTCLSPAQVLCWFPCVVWLILGMIRGNTGPVAFEMQLVIVSQVIRSLIVRCCFSQVVAQESLSGHVIALSHGAGLLLWYLRCGIVIW